jgi:hypothetical protein
MWIHIRICAPLLVIVVLLLFNFFIRNWPFLCKGVCFLRSMYCYKHPCNFSNLIVFLMIFFWGLMSAIQYFIHIANDADWIQVITQIWVLLLGGLGLGALLDIWVSRQKTCFRILRRWIYAPFFLMVLLHFRQGMIFLLFFTLLLVGPCFLTYIQHHLWRYLSTCALCTPHLVLWNSCVSWIIWWKHSYVIITHFSSSRMDG